MPTLYQWSVPQRRQPTFVWAPSRDIDRPTRACGKPEAGSHSPNRRQHVHLHSMTLDMKILLHLDPFFFFFLLFIKRFEQQTFNTDASQKEWVVLLVFVFINSVRFIHNNTLKFHQTSKWANGWNLRNVRLQARTGSRSVTILPPWNGEQTSASVYNVQFPRLLSGFKFWQPTKWALIFTVWTKSIQTAVD